MTYKMIMNIKIVLKSVKRYDTINNIENHIHNHIANDITITEKGVYYVKYIAFDNSLCTVCAALHYLSSRNAEIFRYSPGEEEKEYGPLSEKDSQKDGDLDHCDCSSTWDRRDQSRKFRGNGQRENLLPASDSIVFQLRIKTILEGKVDDRTPDSCSHHSDCGDHPYRRCFMKIIYLMIGFLSFALGCVGIVLPVLPTTPFLLLAAVCFARGSSRIDRWFRQTKVYKNHLEGFIKKREMEWKTKAVILAFASTLLLIAFFMMENVYGRVFILGLILFKYYYFTCRIKTVKKREKKGITYHDDQQAVN